MYKYKKSVPSKIFDVFNVIVMVLIAFICIAPVLHVLFASVSDPARLASHTGIVLRPLGFTLVGYEIVFGNSTILVGYLNTIFYVVAGVSLSTFLTVLGGLCAFPAQCPLGKRDNVFYNGHDVF